MTTQLSFADHLPRTGRGDYELYGHIWMTYGADKALNLHIRDYALGLLMISLHPSREQGRVAWEWACLLVDGIYARQNGTADSVEEAAAAALSYTPEVVLDAISGHQWLRMSDDDYFTHFGGEQAVIRRWKAISDKSGWRWERDWAPVANLVPLLEISRHSQLSGMAETPALAMLAAEQAPADMRRACMQLLAATKPATPASTGNQ